MSDALTTTPPSYLLHYTFAVMVRRCLENKAPKYLSVHCTPVTAVNSRHRRSANQHQLIVPRCRRITFSRRAFSVAGPTVWNSLPTEFRSLSVSFGDFRRTLKTILFTRYYCTQRSRDACIILRCINFCSTSCHPDGHAQASEVLWPHHPF